MNTLHLRNRSFKMRAFQAMAIALVGGGIISSAYADVCGGGANVILKCRKMGKPSYRRGDGCTSYHDTPQQQSQDQFTLDRAGAHMFNKCMNKGTQVCQQWNGTFGTGNYYCATGTENAYKDNG